MRIAIAVRAARANAAAARDEERFRSGVAAVLLLEEGVAQTPGLSAAVKTIW
jgi:hypothetical protein